MILVNGGLYSCWNFLEEIFGFEIDLALNGLNNDLLQNFIKIPDAHATFLILLFIFRHLFQGNVISFTRA